MSVCVCACMWETNHAKTTSSPATATMKLDSAAAAAVLARGRRVGLEHAN